MGHATSRHACMHDVMAEHALSTLHFKLSNYLYALLPLPAVYFVPLRTLQAAAVLDLKTDWFIDCIIAPGPVS